MSGSVIGNFKILGKIGEGGMGSVFLGLDLMLDRRVALKMLRPELAQDPAVVERFRSEAVTLGRIHHPRVAMLYSFMRDRDDYFMVMEYVDGQSLDRALRDGGAMPCERAIPLFCQALEGIEHAHRLNIIHRDLKPANLMLLADDSIKVMDFGIARVLGAARMTRTGRVVGTVEYMSPEQIRVRETDARSDIYSLGIVLYEMLTGRVPFQCDSEYELMKSHLEEVPPPPREFARHIPPALEAAILKALAKRPEDRFASADEFRRALLAGSYSTAAAASLAPTVRTPAAVRATRLAETPEVERTGPASTGDKDSHRTEAPARISSGRAQWSRHWPSLRLYLAGAGLLAAGGIIALLLLRGDSGMQSSSAGQVHSVGGSSQAPAKTVAPTASETRTPVSITPLPVLTPVEAARASSQPDSANAAAERDRDRRRKFAEKEARRRASEKALDLQ